MSEIHIWTDGSCDHHDVRRPGGFAFDIYYIDHMGDNCVASEDEDTNYTLRTTNNQMELMAILEAVQAVKKIADKMLERPRIYLHTDSKWAINCLINPEWNCRKDPKRGHVLFLDEIEWAMGKMQINFVHVHGHAGIEENERVNDRAKKAMEKARSRLR
jgi:ribonuclease HI